jgi:hypothetical protein
MTGFRPIFVLLLISTAMTAAGSPAHAGLGPSDSRYWPSPSNPLAGNIMGAQASIQTSIDTFKSPCQYRGGPKAPPDCVKSTFHEAH